MSKRKHDEVEVVDVESPGENPLLARLKAPDFVLDFEMPEVCKGYVAARLADGVELDQAQKEIISALKNGFEGSTNVANVVSSLHSWIKARTQQNVGGSRAESKEKRTKRVKKILKNEQLKTEGKICINLEKLIEEKFDSETIVKNSRLDMKAFNAMVAQMCHHVFWRKTMIKLLRSHKRSPFCIYLAKKLTGWGYHHQIAKEAATVDYFEPYQRVLIEALHTVPTGDWKQWEGDQGLTATGELAALEASSFLYANALLEQLANRHEETGDKSKQARSYRFRCVQQEFRRLSALSKGANAEQRKDSRNGTRSMFLENLRDRHGLSADSEFFADIELLHKRYDDVRAERERSGADNLSTPNFSTPDLAANILTGVSELPARLRVLQQPEFFKILLLDIYHPYHLCRDDAHRNSVCDILARMSSNAEGDCEGVKIKLVQTSKVCNNPDNLQKIYRVHDMYHNLAGMAFGTPVVCMGVLLWGSNAFQSNKFWVDKKEKKEIQDLLNLFETVGQYNNLHIPELFRILQDSYLFVEKMETTNVRQVKVLFLEKLVDMMMYSEPISILKFFMKICQPHGNDGKARIKIPEVRKVLKRLMRSIMPPFSEEFSLTCCEFLTTNFVRDSCYREEDMQTDLKKFLMNIRKNIKVENEDKVERLFRRYNTPWNN